MQFVVSGEGGENTEELRGVVDPSFPPVYSAGSGSEARRLPWVADLRDEEHAVPGPLEFDESSGDGKMRRHDSA